MRSVGELEGRELAERFSGYLQSLQIAHETLDKSGKWEFWVVSEDDVVRAAQELAAFIRNPDEARFRVTPKAIGIRPEAASAPSVTAAPAVPPRRGWFGARELEPLTMALIGISIAVAVFSNLGQNPEIQQYLACDLRLVARGQVWRLLTPIFLHFGFLHILFNMMWLHHLGRMIERVKSTAFLLLLVAVTAVLSNTVQAVLSGPSFGGMSGVVYGLFGYVWMKSRYEPFDGLLLDDMSIFMMIGWFVLGFTGSVGPIANWCHGVGLLVGVVFGIAPTVLQALRRRKG